MATNTKKLAFVSYRREDSSAPARSVRDHIEMAYGSAAVFMDVDRIRVGAKWQEVIRNAIARADVLVLVIGPTWLRMDDEFGRRRIDKDGDWVREEIALSLLRGIPIIPLLVARNVSTTGGTPIQHSAIGRLPVSRASRSTVARGSR